jgi:excisionase family DNA binding protein
MTLEQLKKIRTVKKNKMKEQSLSIAGEKYLTRSQIANAFSVNIATVSDWINQGVLKPYRMGKRLIYFKESEVSKALTPVEV